MKKTVQFDLVYAALGAGLATLIVVAVLATVLHERQVRQEDPSVSPAPSLVAEASPSPGSAEVEPVIESPSPTPTVSPTAPGSPSISSDLPGSAKTFLANFYAAYSGKDRDRINASFTADASQDLKSLRSRLFTGKDIDGTPGGPTLFATNTADQRATGYTVSTVRAAGTGWNVTVQEQRVRGDETAIGPVSTILTLTPSVNPAGSWLIESYTRVGGTGKYDALLTE